MFARAVALAAGLITLSACSKAEEAKKAVDAAEAKLKAGDLPGACADYDAAAAAYPETLDAATGSAFCALATGDTGRADQILAAAEATAKEQLPQVKLRRALVALSAGKLEEVKTHGEASGLPLGKLLSAEVNLADGERDQAKATLESIQGEAGAVGDTVKTYLALIGDESPMVAGLAEAQALWALGEKKVAVKSAEELVLSLPDDREDREEQLLVWAGRAASLGEVAVARALLAASLFPPDGQAWRKVATEAIAACAEGDAATCQSLFATLEAAAPADGLADARATAAFLIAPKDKEAASALAGPYMSNGAARALWEAGDASGAQASAPGGVLASYLKAGG